MLKQGFEHFSDINLIVAGFILFMLTFLGVFLWTYMIREKNFYRRLASKPLNGDQ